MNIHTLAIVGVGLIGGSIGLAAKRRGIVRRVVGVARSPAALDEARAVGAIDDGCCDLAEAVRGAEMVIVCTPVDDIARQVLTLAPACAPGTVVTDAGSTKVAIVAALEGRMPKGVAFVGGHPLAGSEKRGVRYANAELFRDRLTVLTPTPTTDSDALERCICFWQALDSRVGHMTPDHHDRGVALTSHLPHLLAAALAGVLPDGLHELVATGFRSTTRIAAGDPSIWTAIFQENRVALLDALALFEERIAKYKQALTTNDRAALDALLDQGKKVRDALGS